MIAAHTQGVEPWKALVVEDHMPMRRLVGLLLGDGYVVTEAATAKQAWALAQAQTFDVAIIDINTPGEFDGAELCRRLRGLPQHAAMKIVLLTGSKLANVEDLDFRPDAFLEKPVRADAFAAAMQKLRYGA